MIKKELETKALRDFGVTFSVFIVVLFIFVFPWIFEAKIPVWPWFFCAVSLPISLLIPRSLEAIYKGWMKLGIALSKVTTPLLLAIVFYFIFSPMGLLMRPFRDVLGKRSSGSRHSYRVEPDNINTSMDKPF